MKQVFTIIYYILHIGIYYLYKILLYNEYYLNTTNTL